MKTRTEYTCPLELTHDITKGKWKPIILWQLGQAPFPGRFKTGDKGNQPENAHRTVKGAL